MPHRVAWRMVVEVAGNFPHHVKLRGNVRRKYVRRENVQGKMSYTQSKRKLRLSRFRSRLGLKARSLGLGLQSLIYILNITTTRNSYTCSLYVRQPGSQRPTRPDSTLLNCVVELSRPLRTLTRSSAVAKRPRAASCLSVVSFVASIVQYLKRSFFIISYFSFGFTSAYNSILFCCLRRNVKPCCEGFRA